jgi:hypothetical protein
LGLKGEDAKMWVSGLGYNPSEHHGSYKISNKAPGAS